MRVSTDRDIFPETRILISDVSKAKDTKTKIEKFTRFVFLSIFAILQDVYTLSIQLANKDIRVSTFQSIDRDKIKKCAALALVFGGFYLIKSKYYNFVNNPEDQVVKPIKDLIQNPQNLLKDDFAYPVYPLEGDKAAVQKAESQAPIAERPLEDLNQKLQCLIQDDFSFPVCSLEEGNSASRNAYMVKNLEIRSQAPITEILLEDLQCLIKDKSPHAMCSFRNISKIEEPQVIKENHLENLKKTIGKIIFNSNMGGIFGRDLNDRDVFIYENAIQIIESNERKLTSDVIQSIEYLLKQMGNTRLKGGDLYKDYGYGHLAVSYINSTSINTASIRQFLDIVKKINYPKKKDKVISIFYEMLRKSEKITDNNTLLNELLPNDNFGLTIKNTNKEFASFSMKSIFDNLFTFFTIFLEGSRNFFKGLYYLKDSSNIIYKIILIEDFSLEKFESIKNEIFIIDQPYIRNELFLFLIIEFLKSISSIKSLQINAIMDLLSEIGDSQFSDKITFKDTIKALLIHKLIESTKEFNLKNIRKIMDLINKVKDIKVKVKLARYLEKFKAIYQLLD